MTWGDGRWRQHYLIFLLFFSTMSWKNVFFTSVQGAKCEARRVCQTLTRPAASTSEKIFSRTKSVRVSLISHLSHKLPRAITERRHKRSKASCSFCSDGNDGGEAGCESCLLRLSLIHFTAVWWHQDVVSSHGWCSSFERSGKSFGGCRKPIGLYSVERCRHYAGPYSSRRADSASSGCRSHGTTILQDCLGKRLSRM